MNLETKPVVKCELILELSRWCHEYAICINCREERRPLKNGVLSMKLNCI